MGWFKLSSRSDDENVMFDTEQNELIMMTQQQHSSTTDKSKSGSLFGTNLLRNRYSVSARIRHGPSSMLSTPSASSYLLLLLLTFAYIACTLADPLSQDPDVICNNTQFRCDCGVPRCIDKSLVKNGEKDCQDGSDEGQWDPSKCAIKNTTSEDIRFKRAASPDQSRVMGNGDATTQFFTGDRARTRPVGLLSTNLGAFVTSGTTTEYLTKILGTYIKGTYARIISTSSKVYHAVATDGADFTGTVRPTGFIASTVTTEVNGYATTLHTTDYYRTYIDGTYAQLVSSYSNVQYPSWFTEQIDPTAFPEASASIFATRASDFQSSVFATQTVLPSEVRGRFVPSELQSKAFAELGVVVSSSSSSDGRDTNRLRALRPNNNAENELRVTGTHGKFVHTGSNPGDETTYNVFTGSYIQNSKTFLFFFGNTAIDPSKVGEKVDQTIMVENGTHSNNVLVDMTKNLRVIVPSNKKRMMVDGSLNGEHMEGVIVEIEGSESGPSSDGDETISVGGASVMRTPSDPRIDMITVNLNKKDKAHVSTSSSSSSSVSSKGENENEIPRARKVPGQASSSFNSVNLIRPSRTRTVSLPTFTVGQPDVEDSSFDEELAATTSASNKVVVNVESSSTKSKVRSGAPVFQKPTTERIPKTTERIQSYSRNSANSYTPTYKNSNNNNKMPNRNHRAFSGFDMAAKFNDIDSDLQSAASTGRATVTYVGFADFTTTVGNTVIVFMPRTKMIEDLSAHISATTTVHESRKIAPTRFVYHTDEETTTPRRPFDEDDDEFEVSRPKGRKVGVSASVSVSTTTSNPEDDEETTTEITPSEAVREISGRQTLLLGTKKVSSSSGPRYTSEFRPIATPSLRPSLSSKFKPSSVSSSSSSSSPQDRRNSLFSNTNRPRYTPKSSRVPEIIKEVSSSPVVTKPTSQSSVHQVASTAVFQTDVLNPTGLVTSIDGTFTRDKTTYLFTSLVYGTFIGSSYAQVIKSTSRLLPVKATASSGPTVIRPTPHARFPRPSKSRGFFNDDDITTTESTFLDEDEGETTVRPLDRMEVSVSSTTERAQSQEEEDIPTTTTRSKDLDEDSYYEDYTTTTEKTTEKENEIERRRKVAGNAKDQIIVDKDDNQVLLEASPTPSQNEEQQTIYVTRTQPTTVYRTYTYYTTYFIPKEDSTITSVTSREVTSTSEGLVRKTFTSIQPTSATDIDSAAEVTDKVEPEKSRAKYKTPSRGKIRPSGAQVIYKTFYTTFTYLTTFFTGQTSSVKSREEIVSNVVTLTSSIGSTATTSVKIRPTSSASLRSKSYKTAVPRFTSSAPQGGQSNVGASSPGVSKFSSLRRPKLSSKIVSLPPSQLLKSPVASRPLNPSKIMEPVTVLKTFFTTYTYFTTLFNGDETSIKSRTEVVTNVVPTVTRTAIIPTASISPTDPSEEYDEDYEDDTEAPQTGNDDDKDRFATSTAFRMSNKNKQKETTFYTTYTYLTTSLGQDGGSQVRSSLKTFTNVLVGDKTIRSGMIGAIEPTKLTGRSAGGRGPKKTARPFSDDDTDLNEVGSNVSETSETTVHDDEPEVTTIDPHHNDYYELEGSETPITTDRSIFDEELDRRKSSKNKKEKQKQNEEDEEHGLDATPILKTYFTTFTYYTTFYQDGSSTVSSRLETKSQVVSDSVLDGEDVEPTASETEALLSTPVEPITFYTTFTYWTTSSIDGSTIVNSREETVTNVVTPGVEEVSLKTVTPTGKALKATTVNEIVPSSTSAEFELTTYFTTFTYYTTSYIGESTVVNSRLETVTNVVTGTAEVVSPTKADARAIGTSAVGAQQLGSDKEEYPDELQTGLLSTIVSSEVVDRTTTVYSTDVFGTYIDGIYAQVLESTSSVITPTAPAETRFLPEATESATGVVSVNEGRTVDADGLATTFYGTTAYGTVIDGTYAQLLESTSSVSRKPGATDEVDATEQQKTGLVRIIDGTLVDGDHTTYYTSSILGTFIGGQYAQVIESTSRYIINPTKSDGITTVRPTERVEVESSITEKPDEDDITTTERSEEQEQEEEEQPEVEVRKPILPGKRPAFGKNRNSSRLSYKSSSKSSSPSITPFASRSRPSGFNPRGRKTQISPTKTEEVPSSTPTVGRGFQSRRKFQRPGESSSSASQETTTPTTATPRLPFSRGTSRFQRPTTGSGSRFASSKSEIQPTSASSSSSSSPGGRARNTFNARGSSAAGARGRVTSSGFARGTSLAGSSAGGFRGTGSTSRFLPGRGRPSASINPSTTSATTVKPTQSPSLNTDEEEYEVEYEYESQQPSSTTTTTEAPRTNRFGGGGGNRFRLNPRLSTPASTSGTTSRPATTRNLPFLRRQTFSKPTLPTRGTTTTSAAPTESGALSTAGEAPETTQEEYLEEEEYEEEEAKPSTTTTTSKPTRVGILGRRPTGLTSISSRPSSRTPVATPTRGRSTTETPNPPQTRATTRRSYTPRPRPAGFPKPIGITKQTTTTEKPDTTLEEYYEDGDFEYEESKHLPANITIDQASGGSEIVETVVKPDGGSPVAAALAGAEAPETGSAFSSPQQLSAVAASQDSVDTVEALLSYAAGSPYMAGQSEGAESRKKRSTNARQVYDYYNSYNPYTYNYNQFGARAPRGTLRSNFPPSSNTRRSGSSSSSSNSNSNSYAQGNSRGGPTYSTSDYDYVEYYDEPSQPQPPPTTAAPARSPTSRLRGRIQPTPTSQRRTPFTLTHTSDNSATSNTNTNTRTSPTRPRTSSFTSRTPSSRTPSASSNTNSNSRPFVPRRTPTSRYQRPTEPPTTTSRTNRFRSRYNPRESVTTAAPTYTRSRFGSQLTRGRGTVPSNTGSRHETPPFEASTITVTHYIPQETTIPIVNGRSTEYKTVLTPSPSVEVLSPFQYTQVDYLGKLVLLKNDEVTSIVNPGVTEITQFYIRESQTSTVTFTPTTIRGRKTSFSHILPSTVYSVEPVVSTVTNPLGPLLNNNPNDPNQLTNLLLNQLLGLNPNILGLQGQQLLMANLLNTNNPAEPATPVTHYSTITTSYTTTVTDFTSTVIGITLHGKAIKTTIVESSTKVISAVEYITSSTVITPSPPPLTQATQQAALNPVLQNLLQSQLLQQQLLQQQQPIVPTQPPQLLLPQVQSTQQVALLQQLQQQLQQQQQQQAQPSQLPPQPPQELKQENSNSNNKKEQEKNNDNNNNNEKKIEVTNAPEPSKATAAPPPPPPASSVITLYVSDEDEGGGRAGSIEIGRAEIVKSVLPLEEDESIVPEQRVSGGRLFIQNGRDFYTKVMSNGVGVIVRGHKTAHIGFDKTPILPHRVSNRPITLPAHTVSRQFHLIESPGRPLNNAISHLLHSIVRSATPDLVTKTMLTTFTYLTTVLRHSNTIIKSREETISNVLTQKFRPTIEYTPSVKAEPSSLPPELLASLTGSSSYFTNTLTTTYIYYNTFTIDSLPVILTSRETVSNVVTLPVYMSPTMVDLMATGSRVFETETYFTTYTFSKTLLPDDSTESEKVVTTKEIITQVVVTEALAPPTSQAPMNTPVPPGMLLDEITKTYLTTFTHLFTEIDDSGQMIVRSSTSISSEVVTETLTPTDSTETITPDSLYKMKLTAQPTITGWIGMKPSLMHNHITLRSPATLLPTRSDLIQFTTIQPSETVDMEPKTLEPVMIYATKTYYTTYTYFTTVLGDGSSIRATIHSRTQIVSKIVTEALSTSFDAYYLNALKSSYLSKHSTMIDITSSVREVTPAKTLDGTERPGTLMTQSVSEPHWPKDNDELAVEIDGTTVNSITGVEVPNNENDSPVQAEIQVSSASSEEHFDEMKDEINKIVNVLTEAQGSEESPTSDLLSPSSTQEPIYSTIAAFTPDTMLMSSEVVNFDDGVAFVETVNFKEPSSYYTFPEEIITEHMYVATEKPITHMPTPPLLSSSPVQPLTTTKPKTKKPFNPYLSHTDIEMFPDIGTPQKSVIIDLPPDIHEYSDEDMNNKDQYMSLLMADRYPHSTSILAKRTGTILLDPVTPTFNDPSDHILSLVSQLADEQHWADYDEGNKDVSKEDEIAEPNIYKISTTFDSFHMPTQMVQVPMKSPMLDILGNATKVVIRGSSTKNATGGDKQEDGGDMKIHNLSDDDFLSDGSGSGSGEGELVEEVTVQDGVVEDVDTETDYRETDHTANPDADGAEEEEIELEGFSKTTESSVPPFPPRTRYTTSQKPNKKKKKTQKPIFDAEQASREDESGESSTKVYSLKVPHLDLLGGGDSVSEESENNSDNKKESEQENDDQSSESVERPQDDGGGGFQGPGPSKSSVSYPSLGPGIISSPGSGPVASTSKIDWKPLLKLGAIGLGGLGASSLTKLAPWFNSMAGSFMKGSLLPLARNDTSPSHSNTYVKSVNGRPIFYRNPPNDGSLIQHSDPVYIPVGGLDDEQDDRIQRRPITSHAKEPNLRPVSLERDHYPPGRGHSPSFEVGPDLNFPPKHNFNFQPPNDHQPNIYSQMSDLNLHKNGEFSLNDPNLRLINGIPEMGTSASDLPMEGKTDFILRPIQNIMNGRPMYDAPKPGPIIPLRAPPHRQFQSGEITKVQRPNFRPQDNRQEHNHNPPEHTDAINDIPDNPRKPIPDIPLLRPVPPTDGIILPHRNRDHNQNRHPSNTDILHAFKHPFIPPPRINQNQNSKEQWPKPLAPFMNSGEHLHNPNQGFDDIINMRPPLPPSENNQDQFGQRPFGQPGFPPNPFEANLPITAEASEENENVFTDIFGVRPSNDERDSQNGQDISFHPHNAGEGPFRPIQTNDEDSPHNRLQHPPQFNLKNPGYQHQSNLPVPHPTGIAGQPSDQFGNREEDLSHEESSESPFHHDFKKLSPPRKPSWPPKDSNAPMSYSYFEDLSHHNSDGRPGINDDPGVPGAPVENEIPPQPSHTSPTHNMQNFPPAPPFVYPPTKHIPPHRQRPSTVYIVQQEEMDAPTTTSTPSPINYTPAASEHHEHHEHEQDVQASSNGVTTPFPKLIIKEIPTRPVAPYYRRSTTTPGPLQTPTNRATIAKLFIRRFSTTTPLPTTTIPYEEDTTQNRLVTWRPRIRPSYVSTTTTTPEPPPTTPQHRQNSNANTNTNSNSSDTLIDSWLVSPTVNDLQDFLEDFKTKFATNSNNGDINNNNNPLLSTANKKSDSQSPNIILPQKFSTQSSTSTTPEPPYDDDDDGDLDSAEYDDDEEDELSIGASSETNSTNGGHHPNHHPIHKPPIDADHFFSTGQGDFAQYYSGTEDRDTIIDPVNQQVIKSPFDDHRRNVSHIINRYRATSSSTTRPIRPIHFRNHSATTADFSQEENNAGGDNGGGTIEGLTISLPNGAFGSIPIENEIADLPGPTTYRPRFDVTFHNKMGTTSEEPSSAPNPTTFRGDIMKPTTFRPGPDNLPPTANRVRPDPTRDVINARPSSSSSATTRRPAPQAGMASFYDDEESLDQLKMKNKEIHKLPTNSKKPNTVVPDVLEALSDEDYESLEKQKPSSTTTSPKSSKEKGNEQKKGEEYEEGEYSEEYDSSYDDDGYIEIPPAGFPSKSDYAPAQSGLKNSAEGKQNTQYIPNAPLAHPTVPPQSRRPGPLEMITNFFRRPPVRPPPRLPNQPNGQQPQHPGGPGRIPFMPNREPTRTMMPPKNSKERPELEFQANNFNPNVKTIPLNPNSVEKDKVNDPIVLMPKDSSTDNPVYTTTMSPRESGEKTTLNTPSIIIEEDRNDQASQTSDATAVTVNPNSNGHRESTYVEDSEYYEDDEMEQDDKNNVIPPDEEPHGPNPTVPPIQFQPHSPPQSQPSQPLNKPHLMEHRPINIGGHLVNGNPFGRPPIANQQRPPPGFIPGRRPLPPFLRPNPNGRPPITNIFNPPPPNPPPQHNVNTQLPPVAQNEPQPPRTEMEPPPIDSNRLKAPILELPSSGPIRYRPINNLHRPNLLRPDDDLFKPTTKVSKTVHTIASVDDLNKIVATNTFTAILPSRDADSPIEPTPTSSTDATENTGPTEIHLEGSESSVVVPSKSTGAIIKMTSVVKYTGGRLETSEIEAQAASDAPSTNSISSSESTVTHIRGPNIIIPTRSSSIQTSSTSSSTPNNRLIGLNRRPPFIGRPPITTTEDPEPVSTITNDNNTNNSSSSVRVTVTMESSVSSEITELSPTTNRRPFIPTRAPIRNTNFPWLRKTSTVPTTTTEKIETTTPIATTTTSSKPSTSLPPRMRGPSITTSEPKETGGFSTTLRHAPSIFNISRSNNRPEILRRPTIVPPRMSAPVTRPSSKASGESLEISSKTSSTESKERPALVFPRLTTFKPPFRRPALNFASSKSRERFTTTLINKITTSGTPPPTRNTSVFSGVLNNTNVTNTDTTSSANVSTTTTSPQSESSEYEEYSDEEYEDEDFELDGGSSSPVSSDSTTTTPTTTTTVSTVNITTINGTRSMVTSTSSSTSVSTSMSVGNETKVISVSSSEISPTRVSNRGNKQKGILNTMVLRGSMSKVPELPPTTRYITHSETDTKTLTETETTVHVTAGTPYTHTIMITKTIPPQTLVSTIVGSVTLVNSIDVRPTTVRSTIISEPTKEVYSFVDTSEATDDNVVERVTTEKVLIGGILTVGNFPRPTPRPTTTSTRKEPTTTTTTKEPKMVRNRPIHIDSGCPANCTTQGNQACRPYANGTKYKCECKPGYARLKRKFPCRPTYTYEVTLAINHMDGMSFDFKDLQNSATNAYLNFITVSKEAVDKAFLSTDIKRQFQGSEIMKLRPINAVNEKTKTPEPKVYVDFLVQLTANVTEDRIRNHLIRTLKSSNFSIGRTGITSTKNMSDFEARDFNECLYSEFNDCSPNAECLNVRGSYSCRCRAGFRDKSPKKHKPGRDCFEMQGCPECNYKGHCRINGYAEPFCECFRWFGGSKCHINLKILLFAIMGVVAILFIFVLLCSVLVCRRTKIHRERPGSGRFMRYRSPTSQATLDRAAIMNDSASSDGRQSPPRINTSFTPDSLLVEGDPKQASNLRGDSLMGMAPDNVHLMNFSLRNVIMDQDRSLTVVIPRAKIRPPSRPPSIHATLGPDPNADLAATERKLINYLDHSPYPPAPYPQPRPPPSGSRQSTIKRHDSRQFRKLSLQEQRKISSGALVSSGTEVSARGGMRRRSIGPEPEPTYSGYEKSFSDLRSITDTMRSPAQQQLFSTDTSRNSCYSHGCKPPSYCAYSEQSVGQTMGDKDGASTVYTTHGKLFRMAQDDTSSTASSQ